MLIRMEKGRITDEETNKKGYSVDFTGGCHCRNPLFLRMKEQERSNRYMKAFEEEQNEEKQNKKDHKKKDSLLLQEGVIGIIEIPSLDIKYGQKCLRLLKRKSRMTSQSLYHSGVSEKNRVLK